MRKQEPGLEFVSIDSLRKHLSGGGRLRHAVIANIDFRDPALADELAGYTYDDSIFLGCEIPVVLDTRIRSTGGLIFPKFENLPFNPYRSNLYSVAELMDGFTSGNPDSIHDTLDAKIYRYYRQNHAPAVISPFLETLACRIHDHAIDRALDDLLRPAGQPEKRVVGIMGGHKLRRDDAGFLGIARIAHRLTSSGYFVATGGGPGAMEAGNLGAWLSDRTDERLEAAVRLLKPAPMYQDPGYIDRAFDVLAVEPTGVESLAIPTWFYGHEPSNLFSSWIAKYFANSIREDGLLTIATYGIIYSPGSAGTIQEIFQDAAQNHYGTPGVISPMVFLGVDYWTRYRPVFPLLSALSTGLEYAKMIIITDDPDEAVRFIVETPPKPVSDMQ